MWRFFWFFFQLAVLVAGAVWLADHPGAVSVTWFDYRVDTSVGVVAAALVLLAALLLIGYRLWRGRHTGRSGPFKGGQTVFQGVQSGCHLGGQITCQRA